MSETNLADVSQFIGAVVDELIGSFFWLTITEHTVATNIASQIEN